MAPLHKRRLEEEEEVDGREPKKPSTLLSSAKQLEDAAADDFGHVNDDHEDTPEELQELGPASTAITIGNAFYREPGSAADTLAIAPFSQPVVQTLTADQMTALKDASEEYEHHNRVPDGGFYQVAPEQLALEATLSSLGESVHFVGIAQSLQIYEKASATILTLDGIFGLVHNCLVRKDRYLLFGSADDCSRQDYWDADGAIALQRATQGKALVLSVTMRVGDLDQDNVPTTETLFFDNSIIRIHPLVIAGATQLPQKLMYPTASQVLRMRDDAGRLFGSNVAEAVHDANTLYDGVRLPDQPNLHAVIERFRLDAKLPHDVERLVPLVSALTTADVSHDLLAGKMSRGVLYHEPIQLQNQPLSMLRLHRCSQTACEMLANTPLDQSSSLFFSGVCAGTVKHRDVQPATPCVFELLVARHSTREEEQSHRTSMTGASAGRVVPIPAPASAKDRGSFAPIAAILRSRYPMDLPTTFAYMQLGDTVSSFYSIALIAHPKGRPHPFGLNYTYLHHSTPISPAVRSVVLRMVVNPIRDKHMGISALPDLIVGPLPSNATPDKVFTFTSALNTVPPVPTAIERERSFREEHAAIIKKMSEGLVLVFDKTKEEEAIETLAECNCTLYGDKDAAREAIRIVREDNATQLQNMKRDNLQLLREVSAAARLPRGKPPASLIKFGGYDDEFDDDAA
ncbi:uncharacterized protein EHS24_003836 [Apiotrichum porosum]|uniref:Uncharacterized protein n=1 Tax=Apiotrichum porosum TaxID=105984 RepID=A0A427XDB1_9TREE|nr:uncharacterized protein EHS24_003836 [Apiotrichum porosum]RSH76901.1 hypothetical protein EHS24_003836 [Apiotrichum porosum]